MIFLNQQFPGWNMASTSDAPHTTLSCTAIRYSSTKLWLNMKKSKNSNDQYQVWSGDHLLYISRRQDKVKTVCFIVI